MADAQTEIIFNVTIQKSFKLYKYGGGVGYIFTLRAAVKVSAK